MFTNNSLTSQRGPKIDKFDEQKSKREATDGGAISGQ
jgi:hypothetical protein